MLIKYVGNVCQGIVKIYDNSLRQVCIMTENCQYPVSIN